MRLVKHVPFIVIGATFAWHPCRAAVLLVEPEPAPGEMFAREMEAQEVDKLRLSHLGWMGPVESAPEDVEASLARLLEDGLLGPLREKTVRATKPDTVLLKPRPLGGAPTGGQPPFATLGRMPIELTAWLLGSSAALLSFSGFLWWKSRRLAEERIEDGHVTLVFAQRHGSH